MKRVVVIGVGALGSHFVLAARNFEMALTIVDFDRVEKKNTMSQFHTKMGVGRNKAQGLQKAMQGLFGLKMLHIPHALREDNVKNLLHRGSLVVDCVDNAEARMLIQRHCRDNDIACVHGALDADGHFAQVTWDEHFEIDEEAEGGQATCEDGEHLPHIMFVSSVLAMTVQDWLSSGEKKSYHLWRSQVVRTV